MEIVVSKIVEQTMGSIVEPKRSLNLRQNQIKMQVKGKSQPVTELLINKLTLKESMNESIQLRRSMNLHIMISLYRAHILQNFSVCQHLLDCLQ